MSRQPRDTISRDTRLNIKSDYTRKSKHSDYRYTIRVGGDYDWNSMTLASISKGFKGKGTSFIGGGMTGDRTDLWTTASKTKSSLKTVGDFMDLTGILFAYNADGKLFVSRGSNRAFKLVGTHNDNYSPLFSLTDGLTMI